MGHRRLLVVALVLVALIAPALLDRDSFPLATYPMYSQSRGDVVSVATADGVTATGRATRLSLEAIGAIDDPLIVQSLVRGAIRGGPDETDALCRSIAARVAQRRSDVTRISIVTETHDVVEHAMGRPSLRAREVHQTCEVDR